jgi:thymidylate synthase
VLLIKGASADEVWLKTLNALKAAQRPLQSGRRESTFELLHVAMEVENPHDRWVTSRYPALNPAFGIAELIWILRGHNDAEFLNYWNSKLPLFAGATPQYRGAYGYRLRQHFGLDQLTRAARILRTRPDTRQVVLQIWDGSLDLPLPSGAPRDLDIPCNLMSILKVREGRLDWFQVLRSNDLFLGLPHNFLQFMTLQEVLAGWIGVEVGTYNQVSDSLHVYKSDMPSILLSEQTLPASNTDSLRYPMDESLDALAQVDEAARYLIRDDASESQVATRINKLDIPAPFRNWMRVLTAESARRRRWAALQHEMESQIDNQVLRQLWSNWLRRLSSPVRPPT